MNLQLVYRYILSLSKNENGALRKKKSPTVRVESQTSDV